MNISKQLRFRFTVLGAFLVNSPIGLPLYIGNLSVYYLSYITVTSLSHSESFSPWVMSILDLSQAIGTLIAGFLPQHIGNRWTLLLGSAVFASGFLSCYITIQKSLVWFMFSLAVLTGIGSGITRLMALTILFTWSNRNKGILSALVPSASGIGSIAINQFITRYINPNEQIPIEHEGSGVSSNYFDQPELLQRVPFMFVYLGCIALVVQMGGSFMVNEKESSSGGIKHNSTQNEQSNSSENRPYEGSNINLCQGTSYGTKEDESKTNQLIRREHEAGENVRPGQLLTNLLFYVFLFLFVSSKQEGLVFYTYYKLYGESWIKSDYFLTSLGTVISISVVLARPLWGMVVDKIGVKPVTVILFFSGGFLFCWMYTSKYVNHWFYCIVCVIIAMGHSGFVIIFPILVSQFFGKRHFAKNLGFLMSVEATVNLATPVAIIFMLQQFGWFMLYAYIGIITTLSCICAVVLIPNNTRVNL